MSQSVEDLMNSLSRLREFIVEVSVPEGKTLDGFIPSANDPTTGLFKIYATSLDDAKLKVAELLA